MTENLYDQIAEGVRCRVSAYRVEVVPRIGWGVRITAWFKSGRPRKVTITSSFHKTMIFTAEVRLRHERSGSLFLR